MRGRKPKPTETKYCLNCGKQLTRRKSPCGWVESHVMFSKRKYCNNHCQREHQCKAVKASASRMRAHSMAFNKCMRCGKIGRMDVHHKDENPLNNNPSNLETLCRSCHLLVHRHKSETRSSRRSRTESLKR